MNTGASSAPMPVLPLGDAIDVYKCLSCGHVFATNADAQTFRNAPPLECDHCPGNPDMQAGRYYAVVFER
jgi:DNA-directed RNA polymerase subunit RPC12/RpoP